MALDVPANQHGIDRWTGGRTDVYGQYLQCGLKGRPQNNRSEYDNVMYVQCHDEYSDQFINIHIRLRISDFANAAVAATATVLVQLAASGDDERDWLAERAPAGLSQSETAPLLIDAVADTRRQQMTVWHLIERQRALSLSAANITL